MDLKDLHRECGQSVWLDYIRRHLLQSGEFARLVREDGVRGVTSNPSIFEKAIAGSTDYGPALGWGPIVVQKKLNAQGIDAALVKELTTPVGHKTIKVSKGGEEESSFLQIFFMSW